MLQEDLNETVETLSGSNMNRGLPFPILWVELGSTVHQKYGSRFVRFEGRTVKENVPRAGVEGIGIRPSCY